MNKSVLLAAVLLGMPVAVFAQDETKDTLAVCDRDRNIFLRASATQERLFECSPNSASRAQVSFSENHESGVSSGTIKAGLVFRLDKDRNDHFGLGAFVETDSKYVSGGNDNSYARIGLTGEYRIEPYNPNPDNGSEGISWIFKGSPYYQTDLNFAATGWGFQASVTPVDPVVGLNAKFKPVATRWIVDLGLDYLNVRQAGITGFVDDTDYGWLIVNAGFEHKFASPDFFPNGVEFGLLGTYSYDAINTSSAFLGTASLAFLLEPSGRSAFTLKHERGQNRFSAAKLSKTSVLLAHRF